MNNLFLTLVTLFFAVRAKAQNPFFDYRVTEQSNSITEFLLNRHAALGFSGDTRRIKMKHLATIKQCLIVITMALSAITAKAQDIPQDDEIVRINTSVEQISVAIEQTIPEPFKTVNQVKQQNFAPTAPIDNYLKQWSEGKEFQEFQENPSLLGKLIEKKNLEDFDEVPGWIKEHLIKNDKKIQELKKRLATFYRLIPEAKEIRLVYFDNPIPFFGLGNRSLLFISTASVDLLSENEFTAGSFHEIAHLIFAEYCWKLRGAENFAAVRQIEMNCDRFSYRMLQKAGIPTKSLESLLRKMDKIESQGQRDAVEAQFHPTLDERLKNLKNL